MTTIDGDDIAGVTIDGDEVQEITVDGDVVWVAIDPPYITNTSSTDDSITMDWGWDGDESRLERFRCYLNGSWDHSASPSERSTTFTGLNAETWYDVGVAAESTTGHVTDMDEESEQTDEAVTVIDDFEYSNIGSNYNGDTNVFDTSTTWSRSGSRCARHTSDVSGEIGRTSGSVSRGDNISCYVRYSATDTYRCEFLFAVQSSSNASQNAYGVRLATNNNDLQLLRWQNDSASVLDSAGYNSSTNTTYEYDISYGNTISVTLRNSSGSSLASVSSGDSTHGSGNIGFQAFGSAGDMWDYVVRE